MLNGLIAIFLAVFAFAGFQTFRLGAAKEELARVQAQAAADTAAIHERWAEGVRNVSDNLTSQVRKTAASRDLLRTQLDSVLLSPATPASAAQDPTPAAGSDDATRARFVAGQLARVAAQVASAADECEVRLSGLQDYVKTLTSTP